MKKTLFILLFAVLMFGATGASAQHHDPDGDMILSWEHNNLGNPLRHFLVRYTINSVPDSIISVTTFLEDSTIVLLIPGDSVFASIQAISIFDDSSDVKYSDMAYFSVGTGIDPPSGILWK